jgi:hypothetical protein
MFLATKKFPIANFVRYPPDFNAPSFGGGLGKVKTIRGEKWASRFHPIGMRKMT